MARRRGIRRPRTLFRNEKRRRAGRIFKVRLLRALGWRDYTCLTSTGRDAGREARQNYLKTGLAAIVKSARKASKVEVVSEDDRDEFSALKVAELRRLSRRAAWSRA